MFKSQLKRTTEGLELPLNTLQNALNHLYSVYEARGCQNRAGLNAAIAILSRAKRDVIAERKYSFVYGTRD